MTVDELSMETSSEIIPRTEELYRRELPGAGYVAIDLTQPRSGAVVIPPLSSPNSPAIIARPRLASCIEWPPTTRPLRGRSSSGRYDARRRLRTIDCTCRLHRRAHLTAAECQ